MAHPRHFFGEPSIAAVDIKCFPGKAGSEVIIVGATIAMILVP